MNAEQHLEVARQYIKRVADELDHEDVADTRYGIHARVVKAADHVENARKLNPEAVYIDGKSVYTIDFLAGQCLYFEGFADVRFAKFDTEVKTGIETLLKALKYDTLSVRTHLALATGYQRLNQIENQYKHINEAKRLDPTNMDAHDFRDLPPAEHISVAWRATSTALDAAETAYDLFNVRTIVGALFVVAGLAAITTDKIAGIIMLAIGGGLIAWSVKSL